MATVIGIAGARPTTATTKGVAVPENEPAHWLQWPDDCRRAGPVISMILDVKDASTNTLSLPPTGAHQDGHWIPQTSPLVPSSR
jgi:hypothetical protein